MVIQDSQPLVRAHRVTLDSVVYLGIQDSVELEPLDFQDTVDYQDTQVFADLAVTQGFLELIQVHPATQVSVD